jgi:alpha 1,3-glucosidase
VHDRSAGQDPYRLYNLDVFEYELDNKMALYGSIPFMISHAPQQSAGVFFHNSAEMWIDVGYSKSKGQVSNAIRFLCILDYVPIHVYINTF